MQHTYIHTHIHTHINYAHTHIHTYIQSGRLAFFKELLHEVEALYIYIYTHIHTYMHTYIHAYENICTAHDIHTSITHNCIHTNMHTLHLIGKQKGWGNWSPC